MESDGLEGRNIPPRPIRQRSMLQNPDLTRRRLGLWKCVYKPELSSVSNIGTVTIAIFIQCTVLSPHYAAALMLDSDKVQGGIQLSR
jgi:hypothetical protein